VQNLRLVQDFYLGWKPGFHGFPHSGFSIAVCRRFFHQLLRGPVPETVLRSFFVVPLSPGSDLSARFEQFPIPTGVQAFLKQPGDAHRAKSEEKSIGNGV